MRLTTLLITFSLLVGCTTIPKPNTDLCVVNAPAAHRKCYNMAKDYDNDGNIKPGTQATIKPNATIDDLNKAIIIDSPDGFEPGWAHLNAYIKLLKEEYKRLQDELQQCKNGS